VCIILLIKADSSGY